MQKFRKLNWSIVRGYIDPKTSPANERVWWPLPSDPKLKPISRKKILNLHSKFMSLNFVNNGRRK